MKIKHNITRKGCTLSGHILETIFEEGEKPGDFKEHRTKDKRFYICSAGNPFVSDYALYVHWLSSEIKNEVSFTYLSEQEAQQALDYINEFSMEPKIEYVYVSDESEEDALKKERKCILLTKLPWDISFPYICVAEWQKENYLKWEEYLYIFWKFAVPSPTDEKKLRELYMTDAEYEKLNLITK